MYFLLSIAIAVVFGILLTVVAALSKRYFKNYTLKSKEDIQSYKKQCLNENQVYRILEKKQRVLTALTVLGFAFILLSIVFFPLIYNAVKDSYTGIKTNDAVKKASTVIIWLALSVILIITVLFAIINKAKKPHQRFFNTKNITRLAIFTALSIVLYMFVKFPLPFIFPSFLDIQISDMPALLAGFMMGPEAGVIVIVLRCLVKLLTVGTSTGGVGELGDLILGLVYVISASIIYNYYKTKKGAIVALIIGSILCVITAMIINRFILIPFYTAFMFPWVALLNMVKNLYKDITQANFYNYYLYLAVLPFNLLRCLMTVLVTYFMYKPTQRVFKIVDKSFDKRKIKKEY